LNVTFYDSTVIVISDTTSFIDMRHIDELFPYLTRLSTKNVCGKDSVII